ncbi:sigma-54 dependent transcriptional regulator [Noviherbaspirillum suwonense]|jgi:two-component system response regulator HydG|uniref:DNA-binding transcriptional response regulator, NtrC family, contains REC, AAA-type ATPase, and a Fis-type DNA-binding domains n=1 Tax=Noviherbaspirillum suwonense TaxID=1224511 RepID=A0ABY1PT95_9BURK|nr:sigma-54 dependent transcriptional regulator [Noviherbaspirillum suwonense]SMP43683.1 DNA-binding transcriptional response regulator, NtrC family, contains REC, AAA-type ATPase, and a Fis-type DNA-binding domains [Noviherbaspirillum suwonense]
MRKLNIIALDEDPGAIAAHLRDAGWDVQVATDLPAARQLQRQAPPQPLVCLLLMRQAPLAQLADIEACMRYWRQAEWIGVCGPSALRNAPLRDLVLNYLFDYHTLPVDLAHLAHTVGHAYGRALLRAEQAGSTRVNDSLGMVGASTGIAQLRWHIRKVAANNAPVLIGGESGSGKELAAQAIHRISARADGPFIAVNCGAISPSLVHSELFGHERGSFTGAVSERRGLIEAANGGTIFLDEIGDLSLDLQINLLRFLQEKTISRVGSARSIRVDARVVAASHLNLEKAVAAGRFRQDLFYRLNVLTVVVPPLRERKGDITMLAEHFFRQCVADTSSRLEGFSQQALAAMMAHDWPGNVRELFNRVQRAVVMTDRRLIAAVDLGLAGEPARIQVGLDSARTEAEREAIHLSLQRVGRNVSQAARELGVSRMTLYRLMEKHGIALDMK